MLMIFCYFWGSGASLELSGTAANHRSQKRGHYPKSVRSFWGHVDTRFDQRRVWNRNDFPMIFWKASLADFMRSWWPKTSQKGTNGTTFGAHLRDKGDNENDALAWAGASFWRSEGMPNGLGWTILVIIFLERHFGFTFWMIFQNLVAHGGPNGSPLGPLWQIRWFFFSRRFFDRFLVQFWEGPAAGAEVC